MSFFYAIFIHDPIPNDLNKLCIILHMGVNVIAETSVLSFLGFHPTKSHLEDVPDKPPVLVGYVRLPVFLRAHEVSDVDSPIRNHNIRVCAEDDLALGFSFLCVRMFKKIGFAGVRVSFLYTTSQP